jgi:hypothetical protein
MKIFGRAYGEYLRFQWFFLAATLLVGLVRLGLSLAGVPNASARWFSVTAVNLAAILYYSVAVHVRGFGGYRQLLVFVFNQCLAANVVIVSGIVVAIATGTDNIFSSPEYSAGGDGRTWAHVIGHAIAVVVASLVFWAVGSLVLWITRKAARGGGA